MNLTVIAFPTYNYFHKVAELEAEQNLVYYASEAAYEMGFESYDELQEAIKRSMKLCETTGLPLRNNFRRIFKSSSMGVVFDWKISVLAYRLVQLNGNTANNQVAKLQIDLVKNFTNKKI